MKPHNWLASALVVLGCLPATVAAQTRDGGKRLWEPAHIDWPQAMPRATVPKLMISSLKLDGMSIVLEKTPLVAVQTLCETGIAQNGATDTKASTSDLQHAEPITASRQ